MKLTREVKVGLLVILGIIFFIFGFSYLKGNNLLESNNMYFTEFDYNGLQQSSPVTIKGNVIGKVKEIKYDFNTGKTRVAFNVDPNLKFSKNSVIRLYETGLIGGSALAIIPSKDSDVADNGVFLKSEIEKGMIKSLTGNFSELSTDLDSTLKSADSLLVNLNGLVTDNSENGLKNILTELNSTLKSYKNLSYSINSVVKDNDASISTILDNFKTASTDLTILSAELKEVNLSKTVASLETTLTNVNGLLTGVKEGEGSLGKLLSDDKLYANLEGAASQMEQLLEDMKLNPKRYVHFSLFGKKAKQYDAEGNEIKIKE